MDEATLLSRIVVKPHVVSGRPTVRGLRVTVDYVLDRLAHGTPRADILADMPELKAEDIDACVIYARSILEDITDQVDDADQDLTHLNLKIPGLDRDLLASVLRWAASVADAQLTGARAHAA